MSFYLGRKVEEEEKRGEREGKKNKKIENV